MHRASIPGGRYRQALSVLQSFPRATKTLVSPDAPAHRLLEKASHWPSGLNMGKLSNCLPRPST